MRYLSTHFKIKYSKLRPKKELYVLWNSLRLKKDKTDNERRDLQRIRQILRAPIHELVVTHVKSGLEVRKRDSQPISRNDLKTLLEKVRQEYREKKKVKLKALPPQSREYYGFQMIRHGHTYSKPGSIIEAMEKNRKNSPETEKKPQSKTNYIGIELEFNEKRGIDFTKQKREIIDALMAKKLGRFCNLVTDGSCGHELRVLLPEADYAAPLKQIMETLVELGYAADARCGTHVHLDMRNRDVRVAYNNLYKVQDVMFKLVTKERRTNNYCKKNRATSFDEAEMGQDRYHYVNHYAYRRHQTLEVRLHHGTLDFEEMNSWLNILLKIVNFKGTIQAPVTKMVEMSKALEMTKDEVLDLRKRYRKYNAKKSILSTLVAG